MSAYFIHMYVVRQSPADLGDGVASASSSPPPPFCPCLSEIPGCYCVGTPPHIGLPVILLYIIRI